MKQKTLNNFFGKNEAIIECSWCKAAGLPETDCRISIGDIGAFDTLLGKPICKKCIETAIQVEAAVAQIQRESIFSKAV